MSSVRETFRARPMAANDTAHVRTVRIGGFLAKTSGTITVIDAAGTGDVTIVDAVPVTAGIYTPIPFEFSSSAGGRVVLGGGASGTLGI